MSDIDSLAPGIGWPAGTAPEVSDIVSQASDSGLLVSDIG